MAPIVEAVDLKKTYMLGKIPVEALRGVNLKVKSGDFLALPPAPVLGIIEIEVLVIFNGFEDRFMKDRSVGEFERRIVGEGKAHHRSYGGAGFAAEVVSLTGS